MWIVREIVTRSARLVVLASLPATATPITFYLDGPRAPEWTPIARLVDRHTRLVVAPGLVAVGASEIEARRG